MKRGTGNLRLALAFGVSLGVSLPNPAHALFKINQTVLWPNGIVPICWDSSMINSTNYSNGQPNYSDAVAIIMEILEDHFPHYANIHFEDAGQCPSSLAASDGAIRVIAAPAGNGSSTVGYNPLAVSSAHQYPQVFQPFGYGNFSAGGKSPVSQSSMLHEFGHALGFLHELDRADFTAANYISLGNGGGGQIPAGNACDAWSTAIATPSNPADNWKPGVKVPVSGIPMTELTAFSSGPGGAVCAAGMNPCGDFDSIMNANYCHGKMVLSTYDKIGLATAYGTPGAQRINAFAVDGSNHLQTNWWNGSSWPWSTVSTTQTAAAGSPVTFRVSDRNMVWVFSLTPSGGMLANWYDGLSWQSPPTVWTDKTLYADPSAVVYRDYGKGNGKFAEAPLKLRVFSVDGSGLVDRHYDGANWSWEALGQPSGTLAARVSAVNFRDWGLTEESFYAFVGGTDNNLYLRYGNGSPSTWPAWTGNLGGPSGAGGSPGTAISFRNFNARVIYYWTTVGGNLWTYYWDGSSWNWSNQGNPGTNVQGQLSASTWTVDGTRWMSIYVVDANGSLHERVWNNVDGWSWVQHGKPPSGTSVAAPSSTVVRWPGPQQDEFHLTPVTIGRYVFVRGSDQKLWVHWTANTGVPGWTWADQTTPYGGPNLVGAYPVATAALAYFSR
jgi:hypothetical protein